MLCFFSPSNPLPVAYIRKTVGKKFSINTRSTEHLPKKEIINNTEKKKYFLCSRLGEFCHWLKKAYNWHHLFNMLAFRTHSTDAVFFPNRNIRSDDIETERDVKTKKKQTNISKRKVITIFFYLLNRFIWTKQWSWAFKFHQSPHVYRNRCKWFAFWYSEGKARNQTPASLCLYLSINTLPSEADATVFRNLVKTKV